MYADSNYAVLGSTIYFIIAMFSRFLFLIISLKYNSFKLKYFNVGIIIGFLAFIFLSEMLSFFINEDIIFTWVIMYVIFISSIQIYKVKGLYESQKIIVQLKSEQEILFQKENNTIGNAYNVNRELYHDMHNHIIILKNFLNSNETEKASLYLDEMYAPVEKIFKSHFTGDKTVDYILSYKNTIATNLNIDVEIETELPINTNISSVDLCTILANMFDNAIETTAKSNGNTKWIRIKIRRINSMIIIKVSNSISQEPMIISGEIVTTKDDKSIHGIGLKSIERIAKKYDGYMQIAYDDKSFSNTITLCYSTLSVQGDKFTDKI